MPLFGYMSLFGYFVTIKEPGGFRAEGINSGFSIRFLVGNTQQYATISENRQKSGKTRTKTYQKNLIVSSA